MLAGQCLRLTRSTDGIVELCFDRADAAINKFDVQTIDELKAATQAIAADASVRGVLVTSAKDGYIVGADIHGMRKLFASSEAEMTAFIGARSAAFTAFAALPVPIVTAINGVALGGGFEMALAADARVLADSAQVGLPEVKLGVMPAFGGCIRLPRLIGAAPALDWIASGAARNAAAALAAGAVDAVVPLNELRAVALSRLQALIADGSWRQRRDQRRGAVAQMEAEAFATLKATAAKSAAQYPAPLAVATLIESTAVLSEAEALQSETAAVVGVARSPTAAALVQLFLNEQIIRKKGRAYAQIARPLQRGAVLGAGIMGGGIAYTSAVRGVPVLMKDIAQAQLDLGKREAAKLLGRQVETGKLSAQQAAAIDAAIVPSLSYGGFDAVDVVVEAVVENLALKKKVFAEVEQQVRADAVLASNTSSLSIAEIGSALQRPENFVGMHFFNPVPVMPLVEVIRGPQTSAVAAATIAGYAAAMGKTPVVVKDGAGFLVNRILNAYFVGFLTLIHDGADFEQVDRAMEAFGWPMGPAYLQDVVGMDTSSHVFDIIAAGYPQRMSLGFTHIIAAMAQQRRYGQKNGAGFYVYEAGPKGRPLKRSSPEAHALVASVQRQSGKLFSDEDIVQRLMLPMVLEAAVCIEDGVVETAAELDMSLILGLGFPRHRGGPLQYADQLGLAELLRQYQRHAELGPAYQPTTRMREMAARGARFHD